MARITVEDCLDNVENRFELVMLATKRARQLATGGKDPLVSLDSDKPTVVALREISEGLVTDEVLNHETEYGDWADDEFEELIEDASLLSKDNTETEQESAQPEATEAESDSEIETNSAAESDSEIETNSAAKTDSEIETDSAAKTDSEIETDSATKTDPDE